MVRSIHPAFLLRVIVWFTVGVIQLGSVYANNRPCGSAFDAQTQYSWVGPVPKDVSFKVRGTQASGLIPQEDPRYSLRLEPGSLRVEHYHKVTIRDSYGSWTGTLDFNTFKRLGDRPYTAHEARITEVYLLISDRDEVMRAASVIASGTGQLVQEVEAKINSFIHTSQVSVQGDRFDTPLEARIPLSQLLPRYARNRINSKPICPGQNCFHAALNFHYRYLPTLISYYFDSTFTRLIENKRYFQEVDPKAGLRFGDMIVFITRAGRRSSEFDPSYEDFGPEVEHALIYIGDGIVFHKPDASRESIFTFESIDSAGTRYFLNSVAEKNRPVVKIYRRKHR